jgi:DNA primase large subunit
MVGVMPAALEVDWPAIKLAFVAGASLQEISEAHGIAFGTLAARSSRENWSSLRPSSTNVEMQTRANDATMSIWHRRAEQSKEGWSKITSKVREHLEEQPVETLLAKADKAKVYMEMERKNLGMDADNGVQINFGVQLVGPSSSPQIVDISSESV